MRLLPRFCSIGVSTTDPTAEDDETYEGKALIRSWLGFTFELQIAWKV
jgi:hypothetical protein